MGPTLELGLDAVARGQFSAWKRRGPPRPGAAEEEVEVEAATDMGGGSENGDNGGDGDNGDDSGVVTVVLECVHHAALIHRHTT